MKILLLEHPRKIEAERCNDIANTPLSSCLNSGYAAAMLQSRGHEVEIVEGYLDNLSFKDIENTINDFKPDLLGVHMVYHWQIDSSLYRFLDQVKSTGFIKYITVYGFYPTIAYTEILGDCPAVDSVIVGEHEMTFAELAEALSDQVHPGRQPEITGIAIRDHAGGISCIRRPLVTDLEALPFPVRTEAMYRISEVNILGSRGCYGSCTFCYINPFYGQGSRWRGRSPQNIIAEIDQIIEERGIKQFYFTDPNFFGPGQTGQVRARHLAALLKERNITFGIEGRVNDIHDETIGALADAGLRHILIGLESGKDSSLKRMNKMTTVAQNEEALRILRKYGIEPNVGFIMFEPDANIDDIRVNFEFLKRNDLLRKLSITANVLYHHQIILKGTPAYNNLREQGRLVRLNNSYEGTTVFSDLSVSVLADLMRKVTNYLFNRMEAIWSGRIDEPEDAGEKYSQINQLLVTAFEDNLRLLESGKQLTGDEVDSLAGELGQKIDKVLGFNN